MFQFCSVTSMTYPHFFQPLNPIKQHQMTDKLNLDGQAESDVNTYLMTTLIRSSKSYRAFVISNQNALSHCMCCQLQVNQALILIPLDMTDQLAVSDEATYQWSWLVSLVRMEATSSNPGSLFPTISLYSAASTNSDAVLNRNLGKSTLYLGPRDRPCQPGTLSRQRTRRGWGEKTSWSASQLYEMSFQLRRGSIESAARISDQLDNFLCLFDYHFLPLKEKGMQPMTT